MRLNEAGQIAEACWLAIPEHFPHVELDAFVVMPNHVHGIIVIADTGEKTGVGASGTIVGAKNLSPESSTTDWSQAGTSKTIGSIVRGFKIGVTKWMRTNTDVHNVWQRNYFEHIVRDQASLNRIRLYITTNPEQWANDTENPVGAKNLSPEPITPD